MKKIAGNFHCIDCRFDMMILVEVGDTTAVAELKPLMIDEYDESDHSKHGHRVFYTAVEVV